MYTIDMKPAIRVTDADRQHSQGNLREEGATRLGGRFLLANRLAKLYTCSTAFFGATKLAIVFVSISVSSAAHLTIVPRAAVVRTRETIRFSADRPVIWSLAAGSLGKPGLGAPDLLLAKNG